MCLQPNENKQLEIELDGKTYARYPIKTHFVQVGEDYLGLIQQYVFHIYQPNDILCISEKIISLCQENIIRKEDMKLSWSARFLSKFACKSSIGIGVNNVYKMQVAINLCGLAKVWYASIVAGFGKLFGRRGLFYEITGPQIEGLDGFYSEYFEEYGKFGILLPSNPTKVCNAIYRTYGIRCIIGDINDLTGSILARSPGIKLTDDELYQIVKDNPAGNSNQLTPFVCIRPVAQEHRIPG